MVRTLYRSLLWAVWGMTALWFSIGFAPETVRGQEAPVPLAQALEFDLAVESFPTEFTEPAAPTFSHPEVYSPAPAALPSPVIGTANYPQYWIVSSRCDIQHKRHAEYDDGVLDVYERSPNGALHGSNMASLSSQIIPGVPVLVCVHGSFVTWNDECLESHAAYQWIRNACPDLPLQVIFFTWPSDGLITGLLPTDVMLRGRQAEFNSFHMAKVISCLPESSPVSFLGHSHGCRLILSTLHLAGGGEVQGMRYAGSMGATRRYRAVLAAAAVDHHWLNPKQRYECAVPRSECIAILRNRKDLALATYPLHRPFALRALSRSGLTRRDERKLGSLGHKVVEIDVTAHEGHNHLWPGYFTVPEIAAEISPFIYYPGEAVYAAPAYEYVTPVESVPVESTPIKVEPVEPVEPPPAPVVPAEPPMPVDTPPAAPPEDDFRKAPERSAVLPGRRVDRERIPLFVPKKVTAGAKQMTHGTGS